MNKVILEGNIVNEPRLNETVDGRPVCNFTMATDNYWETPNGEKRKKTEFHRIAIWGKAAERTSEKCQKGDHIYLEGRLQTEGFVKDGVKVSSTSVHSSLLKLLRKAQKNLVSEVEEK